VRLQWNDREDQDEREGGNQKSRKQPRVRPKHVRKPAFSGYKAREFQRNEHEFQIYILDIEREL
jgi:hypothetical protein